MSLVDLFDKVSPSIVALIEPSHTTSDQTTLPALPHIIGTGFFVRADGIVATNRHVVEPYLAKGKPELESNRLAVLMFGQRQHTDGQQISAMRVDIDAAVLMEGFSPNGNWFGEETPDIAFVRAHVRDVHSLTLAKEPHYVRVGTDIATIGFPLGASPLTIFGKLNQIAPFLRRGIVSSLFPVPFAPSPHGFTIDILQQGGSSGSPIFQADDGAVVGMMAASVLDYGDVKDKDGTILGHVQSNTNISICVPSAQVWSALNNVTKEGSFPARPAPTVNEDSV